MDRNSFLGNQFVWWVGVVENEIDPLGAGRAQVRIFGWHTADKSLLPSKDLPWAHPVHSINNSRTWSPLQSAGKDGTPADWVVGFFMDGESGQFPVMFGVLPGIPQ
jgi:hypothetical protein